MKVLVTGANGFIGSALCPHLAELGHKVVPVVRRQSNIANEVIVHDAASWKTALNGCDSVIHLAARAHVMQDQERNPLQAFRVSNLDTAIEMAKRAVEAGVRRFVFMSTIKVNGEETASGCSFRPEDSTAPKDPYAISKWEAEQGLFEIAKRTGLEVVIIRPPLVYGPGVKGNFATLIKWVRIGVPLPFGSIEFHSALRRYLPITKCQGTGLFGIGWRRCFYSRIVASCGKSIWVQKSDVFSSGGIDAPSNAMHWEVLAC